MIGHLAELPLPAASWILFASLKSLIVIPLLLLMRRLCARWLTPQGRYGLWFALIACLAMPFGAQVRIPDVVRTPAPVHTAVAAPDGVITHAQPVITISDAPAATASDLSLASKAVLLWLLGVAGLSAVVLYNVTRFRRITSRAADVDAATDELFRRCRESLNIRHRMLLRESPQVESPLVVGYWGPTLLLPRNLSAQISREQLRLVLLHELAHVRRHDILVNWLLTCVQVAHWFNPLAWYALRIMRDDMEQACDATVLRRLAAPERIEYGNTLIRMAEFTPRRTLLAQNAAVIERHAQLKARINMITRFRPRSAISTMLGAALLTLAAAIAVTQAADAPPLPAPSAAGAAPVSAPTAAPPSQPTLPAKKTEAKRPTPAVTKKPVPTASLETDFIKVNYARAGELVSYIESAPRLGLLSEKGNIGVNERDNTIVVSDIARNVAVIRQLIAQLDVPVKQVLVEAYFALVDSDLVQEWKASAPKSGVWSSAMVLGPGKGVVAALKDAHLSHRAEIFSSPRYVVVNRTQASVKQSADMPPPQGAAAGAPAKHSEVDMDLTPTVRSDQSMQLHINTLLRTNYPGTNAPVSDMAPFRVEDTISLDSGAAVMVDMPWKSSGTAGSANAAKERRLIAIVVPQVLLPAKTSSQ